MDEVWATGRRHVKISKLYLKALLRRGPNIFVALAWSQAFWLVLEAAAGNEDSRGYVRLSSVALYALVLHTGGHVLLLHYKRQSLNHHAFEFLLDLVTDVVGFAWINVAEEMLAQVFLVTARTAFSYAVLSFTASLGAMEIGSRVRGLLDWPLEFDEIANQFDAGSFALPTSWLVTQAVHIALYGFFYRTSAVGGQGGRGNGSDNDEVDVRLVASLFLLVYALLCSTVAARLIGGTVAAATFDDGIRSAHGTNGGGGGGEAEFGSRSDLVLRAVEAGGPFTAALASDATAVASSSHGVGRCRRSIDVDDERAHLGYAGASLADGSGGGGGGGDVRAATTAGRSAAKGGHSSGVGASLGGEEEERGLSCSSDDREEDDDRGAVAVAAVALMTAAAAAAEAGRARRDSLRRGLKTYMRLTVGMMVGWAYNLWGQVEFRQEELEFRFGPALGATVYAMLSTALGVCIMVRGADKLDGRGNGREAVAAADSVLNEGSLGGNGSRYNDAVRAFHARRMLVVVGGVSLMVGWAWEEAFDLLLEAFAGDSADAGMIVAKLALALVSTAVVLGREMRSDHYGSEADEGLHRGAVGGGLGGMVGKTENELMEPLMTTDEPGGIQQ